MMTIGMPMTETELGIPPCWNRPPMAEGRWLQVGFSDRTTELVTVIPPMHGQRTIRLRKPRLRWTRSPFIDRCTLHDDRGIGPNGEPYPESHGWLPWCALCRWMPKREWSPADLYASGDGYMIHEVDGQMVQDVYLNGHRISRTPMDQSPRSNP